jgi:site-specific recombinase XerD
MILGRGTAQTDAAIIAEYRTFLATSSGITTDRVRERVGVAAGTVCKRIGKPIAQWIEEDMLALFSGRCKMVVYGYSAFLAFLIFRGYVQVRHLTFFAAFPLGLSRLHRPALQPIRDRLEATRTHLGYASNGEGRMGSILNLLIELLAFTHKPLMELTHADFDTYRTAYDQWYQATERRADGEHDWRLPRLERYLVQWGVLPPPRRVFKHDEHFASLHHEPIKQAILAYMRWCDAKYQPSTIDSCRASVLGFFVWLQAEHPPLARLDSVTRPIALAYATHLKRKVEDKTYAAKYRTDLYRRIRLFYEFAIVERLETSPNRNPFALGDTPSDPDPLPRYLTDHDIQVVLRYCAAEASLLEHVVVTTLLHTGIRACELAGLKSTDIIQVQGRWKLHIHEGKGLKDRIIPLTQLCLDVLRAWEKEGKAATSTYLFTSHGRPWSTSQVCTLMRELGLKLGLSGLTPHRFRHTFAVALLNYGIRESALQKMMGHKTLGMTLEYARILDTTVEQAFSQTVERMQTDTRSWVPSFFASEEYTLFAEGDMVSWIRLPLGYCRRNPKLHCESDVKCLLCDRFAASPQDLPRLQEMHERFLKLGMQVKADVVAAQIRHLEAPTPSVMIPLEATKPRVERLPVPPQAAAGHPAESRLRGGRPK